ncbi:androgen-dependent TFPI-regulating protein isoform X4 [Prionailurus viverrinus]|uniref:androgen-dependent TFPI-regulating protein isoform X4 n=1 Tax=Prionailurus viverrinus TaxID=61388 RepID=UPI001FF2B719|nr:androgen-dependent TFPI-regulating protein isoform X4 [Prionailurus viverrinus]
MHPNACRLGGCHKAALGGPFAVMTRNVYNYQSCYMDRFGLDLPMPRCPNTDPSAGRLSKSLKGFWSCSYEPLLTFKVSSSHTSILPFSLVEVILRPHCYPLKKKGLTLLAVASLAYISRVLWIYSETGTWVYPLFARLSPVGLTAFFSLSYIFTASIYLLGEKLNHWKWDTRMLTSRCRSLPQEEKHNPQDRSGTGRS